MRLRLYFFIPALWLFVCASCGKTNAEWESQLTDRDPFVAGVAAIGLSLQDPAGARAAIPVLLATIDRSEVGLQAQAAEALFRVGPQHVDLLLENLVVDELMSFDRLGTIKNTLVGAGPRAVQQIVGCLAGPGRQKAGDLGQVLLEIGEPSVVPLINLLEQAPDNKLKNYAAFLLGNLGPRSRPALPALQRASASEDLELRAAAKRAIAQIQGRTSNG